MVDVIQPKTKEDRLKEFIYWNTFNVYRWYEPLKECTFCSHFLFVTRDEAEKFVKIQKTLIELNENEQRSLLKLLEDNSNDNTNVFPELEDDIKVMKNIATRLEPLVSEFVTSTGGAFVKMSDRSPKDAATELGRIQKCLEKPLAEAIAQIDDISQLNSSQYGLPAIYRAYRLALKVTSGIEAMQLLLMSFRTMADVEMRLEYATEDWDLCIMVREWREFDQAMEFRAFVYQGELTCMSQYFYDCYFPILKKWKTKITQSVHIFWESMKDKVPYDSYVIDFVVMPCNIETEEVLPVQVIELNPFDESTDGALCNWKIDVKKGPFRLKLVEEPKVELRKSWWRKIIQDYLDAQSKK